MSEIISFFSTLFAAFAGAWAAFKLEERRRQREKIDDNVVAGNLALLTLSEIWNVLRDYQKTIVEEWRGRQDVWLNLPATPQPDPQGVTFDTKGLSFLLESYPAAVQKALLERRRFQLAIQMINSHSNLVLSEVFPILSSAGVTLNQGRPEAEIERLLGIGIVRKLKVITAAMIENVDQDVASSRKAFSQLRTTLKAIYPQRKFIDLPPEI